MRLPRKLIYVAFVVGYALAKLVVGQRCQSRHLTRREIYALQVRAALATRTLPHLAIDILEALGVAFVRMRIARHHAIVVELGHNHLATTLLSTLRLLIVIALNTLTSARSQQSYH